MTIKPDLNIPSSPPPLLRVGVVVPLANEGETVTPFLSRVVAQLSANDHLFCVVDNVSRDNTRALIEKYGQETDPRVVLVWAPGNRCVVDAYFRGYRAAYDAGAQWILEMDGGLSHKPEEIPRFIAAMESGVEFAGGSRFMPGGSYTGPWSRYILSKGGTVLANFLIGTRMRDMTSGFECFTRDAMELVLKRGVRSRAHFFQTEIRFMLRNHRWVEVPIHYTNPSTSVGTASIKEALRNLWALRRESRESKAEARRCRD